MCDKMQTNADRIRNMSDEELADFLANCGDFRPCWQCDYVYVNRVDAEVPTLGCTAPCDFVCTKKYAAALTQRWLGYPAKKIK